MVPVKHCQRRTRGSRKAIKANPAARDSLIDREFPGWVRAFGGPLWHQEAALLIHAILLPVLRQHSCHHVVCFLILVPKRNSFAVLCARTELGADLATAELAPSSHIMQTFPYARLPLPQNMVCFTSFPAWQFAKQISAISFLPPQSQRGHKITTCSEELLGIALGNPASGTPRFPAFSSVMR